ncbi:MAG: hypothetical protein COZ29_01935 [Candidatus Moranbacteria bacterium CG_4_10_14_3_um_filter_45_9]|nr:MAG: hypothetical protein AUK19_01280 [Candidatus Moranbacteria bacterium CG2_30_45_14]PIX90065.1 MAG: hypothetical protein COZ29_01935 [Candidatus Moranbacteria bacterium CG_4_10_14_3_um_filter_45_9]PJA85784.1 MAG: hypothetical protein CO143_00825 [Candidatus Moranbacteria bacterium CG_4_9_14_3_um_filter_45_14]
MSFVPFEPGMEGKNFIPYEAIEEGLVAPPVELLCTRCQSVILAGFETGNGEYFHPSCADKE